MKKKSCEVPFENYLFTNKRKTNRLFTMHILLIYKIVESYHSYACQQNIIKRYLVGKSQINIVQI